MVFACPAAFLCCSFLTQIQHLTVETGTKKLKTYDGHLVVVVPSNTYARNNVFSHTGEKTGEKRLALKHWTSSTDCT